MIIQVYAPTSNAEETEIEGFYEDLQDLPEVTPKKDVFFNDAHTTAQLHSSHTLVK